MTTIRRSEAPFMICKANMKKQHHDPEWLLKDPRIRKWLVQCAACQRWGYPHNAPVRFFGRANLEDAHFEALKLDERGLCEQCRAAVLRHRSF